jgi:hypothetical protein
MRIDREWSISSGLLFFAAQGGLMAAMNSLRGSSVAGELPFFRLLILIGLAFGLAYLTLLRLRYLRMSPYWCIFAVGLCIPDVALHWRLPLVFAIGGAMAAFVNLLLWPLFSLRKAPRA